MCVFVSFFVNLIERAREMKGSGSQLKHVCLNAMTAVIGALGGVERQCVVAIEGKCRLVTGLC